MIDLSYYIKLRNSAFGCDAKQFECDKYLDCDICLEDKIIEHDKHIIKQYKENTKLKDKIKEHDKQIRANAIDEVKRELVHHLNDYALQEAPMYQDAEDLAKQRPVYLAIKNCINGVIEITEQLKKGENR